MARLDSLKLACRALCYGFFIVVAALGITACSNINHGVTLEQTVSTLTTPTNQEDIAIIMKWWNGDYNNDVQINNLRADGAPIWQRSKSEEEQSFGGHLQITAHYRPVDLPAFGDHVIYVEETSFGDPDSLYRQRIYTVQFDAVADSVEVKLWYFKDKKKFVGAWKDLSLISELSPDDMSPLPDNCDLTVSKLSDNRYHMEMPPKKCLFGERYFDYQVMLGPEFYWFRDRIVNAKDDVVVMTAGSFTYHKLGKLN